MAKESKQEKYKRWYEKGFFWVYKQNCIVCGQEFYARSKDQTVCDSKACQKKWEKMKPETVQEETSHERDYQSAEGRYSDVRVDNQTGNTGI